MRDIESYRLDNGLSIHIVAGHAAPVVAIQAWVGVGSADETGPHAGLAHVLEHMLFKGDSARGVGELARTIANAGGEVNAWTSFDHTVYHAVVGRAHIDDAIDAIGDVLTSRRIDPEELAREREVILEEIRSGSDDPARLVAQSLFATAYAMHPYRRPVIGTAETVRGIRERDVVEFFRSYYVADNVTIVVAGDVDKTRIRDRVSRRFAMMPTGRPARRHIVEPAQTEPRATATWREVSEAYVAVGFHVPPARHPDVAALDVAAILLGETESARLQRRLRDDAQVVTSAHAHIYALRDPGLFVLSATTRPHDAEKSVSALVDQALTLVHDVTSDELDKARIGAEAAFVRQFETAQGSARTVGWNATVAGDPNFAHIYLDRTRAVRRHDVATAVRRYLRPDNAAVAALLPKPKRKSRESPFVRRVEHRVRKSLGRGAELPVVIDKRVVLPNGMVVIVRRDPSVPMVAMRAVWRGGQRAEPDRQAGVSALLARVITCGSGRRGVGALVDRVDRLGGSLLGSSGRNSLGIAAEWLARSWRQGFEVVADSILRPTFDRAEIAHHKRLILDDQVAQADNPTHAAFRLFREALYGSHPYHRDGLGTPDSIARLTAQHVAAFYRAHYPISALTLSIVGDVDLDEAVALATQRFGRVKVRAAAAVAAKIPTIHRLPAGEREVCRHLDRSQAYLVVGYPGATIDARDRFALEVLIAILGGQSGRLFAELRDKRALVYRVSAHSVEGIDPGFIAVYLACSPDKLEAAKAQVHDALAAVRSLGVSGQELERAQRYLVGTHHIAMQRRSAVANAIAYHEAYGLGWTAWSGYESAIGAVTTDDIMAAARRYFVDDHAIVATVRPRPSRAAKASARGRR